MTAINAALIRPRRMDFEFAEQPHKHWFNNDPFWTAYMTALSLVFPSGEQFFVDSVRHYQDQIQDPQLKQRVRGFIGQEAHHSKEHTAFNDAMGRAGYPVTGILNFSEGSLQWVRKHLSPARQLAMTCALEHFTAILAKTFLSHPNDFFLKMDQDVAPLWLWHAIEESEHKAVAFDVFAQVSGSYWIRTSQMLINTLDFVLFTLVFMSLLLKSEGRLLNLKMWAKGLWQFYINPGWMTRLIPAWLAYFKPGFHPNQDDTQALLQRSLAEFRERYHRDLTQ
ncbi:MAG TPA: metal-dependent hydrolase [Pseudomonadales bacterium]|nr:metal-dependent hydrolase [Pseudomonadales bacterium]